jgi:predicted transglutaminase-like cysteine proteinase
MRNTAGNPLRNKYTGSTCTRLRNSACALCLLVAACFSAWVGTVLAGPDFDRLLRSLTQRFGPAAQASYNDWRKIVEDGQNLSDEEKLRRVNQFFNRRIRFGDDIQIWGQTDYWATPMETLGRAAGDCEDFAIAKYFTLRSLNVATGKLRLVYVRARFGGPDSQIAQAHMVLTYYATPDAEPLVLDSLISDIRPASRRPDLTPVYSFNSDGLWVGAAPAPTNGGVGRLSRWQELLKRARDEGFE